MLSANTNSLTWVAVATGLVLVVGGGALTLYPDAFNSLTSVVQKQTATNATDSKDSTDVSNLAVTLSDGASTVKTDGYRGSLIASGNDISSFKTIATSEYSSSQQASLASAVSGDSRDATTAFVQNPDYGGIVWIFDGTQPLTNAGFDASAGGWVLDTSKINDSDYYNVGVLVYYNDANAKQANGSYLFHTRIVNIKATGAQLKSWSALAIKENNGSDYSGVTNAISNQNNGSNLKSLLSNLNLSSDTSKWTSADKSSIISQMSAGLGTYSTTDILSTVLPQIIDSSN